jgi:hypothetical protein
MAALFFISCGAGGSRPDPNFGIVVYDSVQDVNRFIPAADLQSGTLQPQGIPMPAGNLVITTRGPYYFLLEMKKKLLTKYHATASGLEPEQQLNMQDIPYEPYSSWVLWINANTVLLGSRASDKFTCTTIDLQTMKILHHAVLESPPAPVGKDYTAISAQFSGNRLFIFYTYQKGLMREHIYPPDDTTHALIYNYPALQLQHHLLDDRTTWPGSYNIWGPNTLMLNDTIYVFGQPGGRTGNHPAAPAALLRIDSKKDSFDQTYLFRLADNKSEEAYTLHDLGNGMAITKMVTSKNITKFDDYLLNETAHYELLDLRTQTKKSIPAGDIVLDFLKNILADGDQVYLPVYLGNNSSKIWIYHMKTGNITPGATVTGRVLRLEKLK